MKEGLQKGSHLKKRDPSPGMHPSFITPYHQNYVGSIPPKHYYYPDGMKEKKAFESWFSEQVNSGDEFDFKKELLEYCKSDVTLLKAGYTSRGVLNLRPSMIIIIINAPIGRWSPKGNNKVMPQLADGPQRVRINLR